MWWPAIEKRRKLDEPNRPDDGLLDFGKHKGKALTDVPNEYLGWLTMWECALGCCTDSDCEGECGNKLKVHRFVKQQCWYSDPDHVCGCSECKSRAFLATKRPHVVAAARELATARRLCCKCWKYMPPVGDARSNGRYHCDWSTRFLHKTCWREIVSDE